MLGQMLVVEGTLDLIRKMEPVMFLERVSIHLPCLLLRGRILQGVIDVSGFFSLCALQHVDAP